MGADHLGLQHSAPVDMAKPDMSTIRLRLRFCSCGNTSAEDISLIHDVSEVEAEDLAILSGRNITSPKIKCELQSCSHSCTAPSNSPSVSLATDDYPETEPISPGELALALSPGTVALSPGNYSVPPCYGMEPYPEPYSPPFPHLRSDLGHSVGPWHYGINPVMAAVSDPTSPRGHDVPDHRGVGQGAHSKVMNYVDDNEQELSPVAVALSPGNNYSVSPCYGMEPYPEPYSPPFPHLRTALATGSQWYYGVPE